MITPSFSLTATERVLPNMALDFTTAVLDSRVTFTRSGNTATVTNSSGVIAAINANLPRFNFNPTTLVCKGLLIEESRTNLLLNSLLDGTNLATQLVTTTAVAHTLSFYGTGQIVLTGTSSSTVVGLGAYPSRTTLTFTPTVGVLTLTVTGTVQYAQLETGSFATTFIPTAATTVTRNPDVAVMTGTNFTSWFNASEGTLYAKADCYTATPSPTRQTAQLNKVSAAFGNITVKIPRPTGATGLTVITDAGAVAADLGSASITANTPAAAVGTYKLNSFALSGLGAAVATDVSGVLPTGIDRLCIGTDFTTTYQNGHIQKIMYWPQRLTNAEVQAFSKE